MKSPLKRITVYDLETGGFKWKHNSITEFAGVGINLASLDILEEFSVMFQPYLDLEFMEKEPLKEARAIFRDLCEQDAETGIKTIQYKGQSLTLKGIEHLADGLMSFYEFMEERKKREGSFFTYEQYLGMLETEHADVMKVYFDRAYNPGALEATHITIDMLLAEGVPYKEAFKQIDEFFTRHTVGNGRPIIAGHNIKDFDNDFMIRLFENNKCDFLKTVNNYMIDTLERARERWVELPNFSLSVCANALDLTLKEAHRALPDTVANARLLIKMLKNVRGEGSQASTYQRRKYKLNY